MSAPIRIDLAGWTREATFGDHRAFLSIFEEADRLGFDGVWFNEFHFMDPPIPYPSTHLLAAAIFARTERLRVGSSVLVLPIHHPLMLAEEIAQLDGQSGGRLDIGVGRGTSADTFASLGIPHAEARRRFEASLRIIRAALTKGRVTSNEGPWRFPETVIGPGPAQRPHPPIYVAGSTAETLDFALTEDLPLLLSLEPPEGRQLAIYRSLLERSGRHGALGRSTLARYVNVAPNAAAAEAALDGLLDALHVRRLHFAALRGEKPEHVKRPDRETVLRDQFVHGTPEACVAQIRRLADGTGIRHLRCIFNGNGVLSNATTLAAMRLFAGEVLPALQEHPPLRAVGD
ncbi:LLM class flavin-dependent oxidoreductase [Phreatobacter sp.]|uniref:LLM class flavin-dependent oxidoreductase n=1 Tax=Phreatobacter sp. TaxID=1966341 RepID=UPI0025E75EBA|nr:LLM class flavin-dependent oxidoreductase [Phreatobacter sp.]